LSSGTSSHIEDQLNKLVKDAEDDILKEIAGSALAVKSADRRVDLFLQIQILNTLKQILAHMP
jgi:hypothetical protein